MIVVVNKVDPGDPRADRGYPGGRHRLVPFEAAHPGQRGDGRGRRCASRGGPRRCSCVRGRGSFRPASSPTRSEDELAAELIRESALARLREELPHALAVAIDDIVPAREGVVIRADLLVEHQSQKGIVIGKHGTMIRDIGASARAALTAAFGTPVHLDLRVRVRAHWRDDDSMLERLGPWRAISRVGDHRRPTVTDTREDSDRDGAMGRRRGIVGVLVGAVLVGGCAVASGAPADERNILLGLERPSAALERFVAEVSDPGSPRYRRHLTVPQMRARFGARPAVVARVRRALAARGVEGRVDPTGTFIVASMDPGDIRATFGRGASLLERGGGDTATAATALPDDLRGVVTEVVGLDGPPVRPAHNVRHRSIRELRTRAGLELPPRTGRAEGCAAGREVPLPLSPELAPLYAGTRPFTPNQFRTAFGFDGLHARGVQGQGMHIALFELDGGVSRRDVRAFAECFDMPTPRMRTFAVGRDDPIAPIDGMATLEATLDVQAVMTAAPRARIDVIQGDGARVTMPEVLAAALDGRRVEPSGFRQAKHSRGADGGSARAYCG